MLIWYSSEILYKQILIMKKIVIIGSVAIVVLGIVAWIVIASSNKAPATTITAVIGDISRDVLVTGTTKPADSVDLSFERTGKVSAVYAEIGDKVKAGQVLVELEKADVLAQLAQAQAAVDVQKAQLDELKRGPRPEQVAVYEVTVANAQVSLLQAKKTLFDSLTDAYAKADDAVHNKTDENFSNPRSSNPGLNFETNNAQYKINLLIEKVSIERMLDVWKSEIDLLTVDSDLVDATKKAQSRLTEIKNFLGDLATALNDVLPSYVTSAAGYKVNVSTARSSIGLATSSLAGSETSLSATMSSLSLAEKNLTLARTGSTKEQISAQMAAVKQAEANLQSIQVSLSKTILRSPIDGVITVYGAKLGQIVSMTTSSLISIISMNKFEVDANIPEVDIGRLSIGQPVKIGFDALSGESFTGTVTEIDPAETIIDGVVNYKIKVALGSTDQRIKSGLTANLAIETSVKKGVVLLPQNAILQNDAGTFVRVPDGKEVKELPVKLGIRGNDGMVEIVSGVAEGDTVLDVGLKTK